MELKGLNKNLWQQMLRFSLPMIPAQISFWIINASDLFLSLIHILGAYRVGTGDGGANEDSTSQWSTGSALAKQVETLRAQGAGGWALYRYGSLFGSAAPEQAAAEREALARTNA